MSAWDGQSVSDIFVKLPSRDVINIAEDTKTADEIAEMFIEDIGGIELSTVTNYQTVFGTNTNYVVVSGLRNITSEYNPADWLLNKFSRNDSNAINYLDYFSGINVQANGDIEINFSLLPNDTDIEIQTDYNAIINIQESA